MQTEILKMSDNNLVEKFEEECIHQWSSGDKLIIREELLKRLSKNNIENKKLNWDGWKDPKKEAEKSVEEFKKKLIDEIKEQRVLLIPKILPLYNIIKLKIGENEYKPQEIRLQELEDLINNIGKEK